MRVTTHLTRKDEDRERQTYQHLGFERGADGAPEMTVTDVETFGFAGEVTDSTLVVFFADDAQLAEALAPILGNRAGALVLRHALVTIVEDTAAPDDGLPRSCGTCGALHAHAAAALAAFDNMEPAPDA